MLAVVRTVNLVGVAGEIVEVETSLHSGLNKFSIIGLPDRSLVEAKERIAGAILSSGIKYPYGKLTVNLSPASSEKHGTAFDLAIALSILLAHPTERRPVKYDLRSSVVLGELGLDGSVKYTPGLGAMIIAARSCGFRRAIIPLTNYQDVCFIPGIDLVPVVDLAQVVKIVFGAELPRAPHIPAPQQRSVHAWSEQLSLPAASEPALRSMAIAAAGRHHLLFDGNPGSGKTSLLSQFYKLLPPLTTEQQLEVYQIHSTRGKCDYARFATPQQRMPHHSISHTAMVGGGTTFQAGEVTLAHRGVLFLDEICEFERRSLEALRQPLTNRSIQIARHRYQIDLPADFQLLATRNPCPCGWLFAGDKCSCSAREVASYQTRLSGPLLDRIDIKLRVETSASDLREIKTFDFDELRRQVMRARELQSSRYLELEGVNANGELDDHKQEQLLKLGRSTRHLLNDISFRHNLTLRGVFKIKKLARTIADLAGSTKVEEEHVFEAFDINNFGG